MDRDFKGIWIPKVIWIDKKLTPLEKIILVEIDSLDIEEKGCFASNSYLAKFCQCTETKVSLTITKLINLGYIELFSFDGRARILKSRVYKNESLPLTKLKSAFNKSKDNNIINNTINNKEKSIINNTPKESTGKRFIKPTAEQVSAYCAERNNGVDGQCFVDFYESKGWLVGKTPMKDWKAAVRTWEKRNPTTKKKEYTDAKEITEF